MNTRKNIGWVLWQLKETVERHILELGGMDSPCFWAYVDAYRKLKDLSGDQPERDADPGHTMLAEAARQYFASIGATRKRPVPLSSLKKINSKFVTSLNGALGPSGDKAIEWMRGVNNGVDPAECELLIRSFIREALSGPAEIWLVPEQSSASEPPDGGIMTEGQDPNRTLPFNGPVNGQNPDNDNISEASDDVQNEVPRTGQTPDSAQPEPKPQIPKNVSSAPEDGPHEAPRTGHAPVSGQLDPEILPVLNPIGSAPDGDLNKGPQTGVPPGDIRDLTKSSP
ncbi:MAG: hypothetical protein LBR80_00405, partial [Deltaproteobacteria bacterium]|nr:hypothetical protein [Deltaproteobacteria bacterium]